MDMSDEIVMLQQKVEVIGNPLILYRLWDTISTRKDNNIVSEYFYQQAKDLIFARIRFLKDLETTVKQ